MCKCGSERIAKVGGKCSDLGWFSVPHLNIDHDGYHPNIDGVCESDYVDLSFCLDCGKIQGNFPISDEDIKKVFEEDEDDY